MTRKRILTFRFCLSFAVTAMFAGILLHGRKGPAPNLEGEGIIFVYFTSHCAVHGDSGNCTIIPRDVRPAFDSMAACSAYGDIDLARANDPLLMASCLKQRES